MGRVVAVTIVLAVLVAAGFLAFRGCGPDPESDWAPQDPLSAEAAAVPEGRVKVLLTRKPESLPADATEARYEWAVLVAPRGANGEPGWAVFRYSLLVKGVGDDEGRTVPATERTRPAPGMMFVRHESERRWAVAVPGLERSRGTSGHAYHVPGEPAVIEVSPRGPGKWRGAGDGQPGPAPAGRRVEIFKPWTYSVEAKQGPLADVVSPVLVEPATVEVPAKIDLLRVGGVVTSLDIRR